MADPVILEALEVPKHPEKEVDFDHADLQFHQVDHSGHSYEVRVYLNNHDATEKTGRDPATGYAGSAVAARCANSASSTATATGVAASGSATL